MVFCFLTTKPPTIRQLYSSPVMGLHFTKEPCKKHEIRYGPHLLQKGPYKSYKDYNHVLLRRSYVGNSRRVERFVGGDFAT
jgi:hypothetical protein